MLRPALIVLAPIFTAAAFACLAISTPLAAEVPMSGSCQNPNFIPFFDTVEWSNGDAHVTQIEAVIPGRLIGPYEEDGGFGLSIIFEEPSVGLMEIVIFKYWNTSSPRLGVVGINERDGERVTGYIQAYEDAECRLD